MPPSFALPEAARGRLEARIRSATARAARERRPVVVAVTAPVAVDLDLSAAVLRARRPDDRFFCLEQPERAGFCLAALGAATLVQGSGAGRFAAATAACRRVV
ncbi:MAG: isochorismate synthase, partial [Thermoleophilaceae bacterium]|nr:isochorismate synthase [Thermoleophilaceae bacterium]